MRIAIFTNNYLPNPFGVAGSIESFRKEFEKRGHTVHIFAPHFEGYVDENPNVHRFPAIDLNFKNIRFPLAIPFSCLGGRRAFRMNKILKSLEIDVIHAQHPNLLGWEARRWARKKKVPLVFTWHTLYDQYTHFVPWFVPKKLSTWWTIRNAANYANKADAVVTPTNSVAEIIKSWGVINRNIVAIPTGVEVENFAGADREKKRQELDIKEDEIVLVLISRLTAEKNVLFLARSVVNAILINKKLKFILAGAGSDLEKMQNIFIQAGVTEKVFSQGIVMNDEKKNIYAAGDIFVFASKSETQGMVISEAMYSGLPIVAVRATGISDLVANQTSGILVEENEEEFAQAILKLAADKNLRKTLAANAREIAHKYYTAEFCAQKMLETYEEAIKRKR